MESLYRQWKGFISTGMQASYVITDTLYLSLQFNLVVILSELAVVIVFNQGKLEEAEKLFLSALQEAKEGFGDRDPHVASAYNNLVGPL